MTTLLLQRVSQTRAALLRLSEDWLQMAEGWDHPPPAAAEQARPIFQQQQQVQLKVDGSRLPA